MEDTLAGKQGHPADYSQGSQADANRSRPWNDGHMSVGVHHIEVWVSDLVTARKSWGWLLTQLGWAIDQEWNEGISWRCGDVYIVTTRPPTVSSDDHDRRRPGINHLALHGGSTVDVDRIAAAAAHYGWTSLYAERYPYAGGDNHYAAYLENEAGFKVEVVGASGPKGA